MQIVRVAHWILSVLMILLGTIHSLMAFHCRDLDEGTLWFLGAGIAIIPVVPVLPTGANRNCR
jgi:hypothetical protein